MNHHIVPTHVFTTVTLNDINAASNKHIPMLLGQAILDAEIDYLDSLDLHIEPRALAVLAEYHMMEDHDHFHKLLFIVKLACAAESRLYALAHIAPVSDSQTNSGLFYA
tara:strand:+ start:18044 stop:18370 length:327 start_codon:yes stop_codon:yes gene_type:complete